MAHLLEVFGIESPLRLSASVEYWIRRISKTGRPIRYQVTSESQKPLGRLNGK